MQPAADDVEQVSTTSSFSEATRSDVTGTSEGSSGSGSSTETPEVKIGLFCIQFVLVYLWTDIDKIYKMLHKLFDWPVYFPKKKLKQLMVHSQNRFKTFLQIIVIIIITSHLLRAFTLLANALHKLK